MIVVKIELWPGGFREKARTLGTVVIANNGEGDAERGNYDAALSHAGKFAGKIGCWKSAEVRGHLRRLSPYHLVARAISLCLGGKASDRGQELIELAEKGGTGTVVKEMLFKDGGGGS